MQIVQEQSIIIFGKLGWKIIYSTKILLQLCSISGQLVLWQNLSYRTPVTDYGERLTYKSETKYAEIQCTGQYNN